MTFDLLTFHHDFHVMLLVSASLSASDEVPCTSVSLGIENNAIRDDQITASSIRISTDGNTRFEAWKARTSNDLYWRPRNGANLNGQTWIQVDFNETVILTGVQIQGSGGSTATRRWIRNLKIQTGNSTDALKFIKDNAGNELIFTANTDADSIMTITFSESISASYIRILPTSCTSNSRNRCGLRFEMFGCRLINECEEDLDTCDDNAECLDKDNGYQCTCNSGFRGNGTHCEDIDECLSSPCLNDATCEDRVDSYMCRCPAGYTGDKCQTVKQSMTSKSPLTSSTSSSSFKNTSVEYFGQQSSATETGIIAGSVLAGILLIIVALVGAYFFKIRKKQSTPTTNPRLDFDGPYDLSVGETQVTPANPSVDNNTSQELHSRSPGNSNEESDDVYHDIQEKDNQYLYAQVNKNNKDRIDSSAAQATSSPTSEQETTYIINHVESNEESNQEPALYANLDELSNDQPTLTIDSPTEEETNHKDINAMDTIFTENGESNPEEPALYVNVDNKGYISDNNEDEGWMDNSIYATSGEHHGDESTEGWTENDIYGD